MRISSLYALLFMLITFEGWSQSAGWCELNGPVSGLSDSVQSDQAVLLSANPGYASYLWSNGHTTSSITTGFSGEYTVTITDDSACVLEDTVLVSILSAYTDTPFSVFCQAQNVNLPVTTTSGTNNASAYFGSTASWLSATVAGLPSGSASRTFETWIYHSGQNAEATIFLYGDAAQNQQFQLTLDENDSLRLYAGSMLLIAPQSISQNNWHHLAIVIESNGKYSFILDFQMLNYDPLPAILNCGAGSNFYVGKSSAGDTVSFQGFLDEMKLWSEALSPFELETYTHFHCNSQAVPYDFIYFDFNEQVASKYFSTNGLHLNVNAVTLNPDVPFSSYQFLVYWQNMWISDASNLLFNLNQTQLIDLIVSDGILQMSVQFNYVLVEEPDLQTTYFVCNADSVQISPSLEYQQYNWSNGQSGSLATFTQSGTYSLSVTSYACTFTDTFQVDLLSVEILQPDTAVCLGETIVLTAYSTENNYYWNTDQVTASISVSPTASQLYIVQTANSYQTCIDSVVVDVLALPESMLAESYKSCNMNSAVLLANSDISLGYLWNTGDTSPGIIAGSSGWYQVSITNSDGCSIKDSTEVSLYSIIIQPSELIVCGIQAITLSASSNSNLLWSNGASTASIQVIPSQSYQIWSAALIDFPQCKDSVVVMLGGNFSAGLPDSLFSCGLSSQLISANQLPVSYSWSNGSSASSISVNETGYYSLQMEDSLGCIVSDTTLVSLIYATLEQSADTICEGEMVMLNAWAGPYDYLWSTGDIDPVIFVYPMVTTNYFISVDDGFQNCYFNAEVYVNQVATGPIQGELNLFAGDSVYLYTVDGADDSEFQWLVSGGFIDSIQGDSIWIVWSSPGEAYIQVTEFAANGCTGIPVELYLEILGSVETGTDLVKIFPNPTKNYIRINTSESFEKITIYSMDGKCVFEEFWPEFMLQHQVDITCFPNGIYYIRLDGKNAYSHKIIKQ